MERDIGRGKGREGKAWIILEGRDCESGGIEERERKEERDE